MTVPNQHSSGEMWGLWKLRRYGGNAVLGEQEANELVDSYDRLIEQLEAHRHALQEIADGHFNFGNREPGLTVMEYARRALSNPAMSPQNAESRPEGRLS